RRGAVERGEEMEEGTLAGAALADDGDHLAGGDGEVEVAKENDLAGGAGVRAGRSRIRRDCRIDFGQADRAQKRRCTILICQLRSHYFSSPRFYPCAIFMSW